jgi:transcriptional regulator with XRE-family HTH domain
MRSENCAAVGALLQRERLAAGLSMHKLARRSTIPSATISRLERGLFRARRTTLSALAYGVSPDRQREILAALVDAAGGDEALVPDGRWRRYRRRRLEAGMLAGDVPLPSELARRIALHKASSAARARSYAVLDRPGALDDPAALDEARRALDESWQLSEQAGSPIVLHLGGRDYSYGYD